MKSTSHSGRNTSNLNAHILLGGSIKRDGDSFSERALCIECLIVKLGRYHHLSPFLVVQYPIEIM